MAPRVTSVLSLDHKALVSSHPADARLADAVFSYWTTSVVEPPARLRVIPDGQIDLVFDLDTGAAGKRVIGLRDTGRREGGKFGRE